MSDEDLEANEFAMHLLVPTEFLRKDLIAMGGIDIADDKDLKILAHKYQVSQTIMALRIEQVIAESKREGDRNDEKEFL